MSSVSVAVTGMRKDGAEEPWPLKELVSLVVAFVLLFGLHFAPTLPGLKPVGQDVLAVFLWFILCAAFESLPRAVLGLAAPMLLVVLAGYKIPDAFSAFADSQSFLAIGAFIFAAIMMSTPLGRRVALMVTNSLKSARATKVMAGLSASVVMIGVVLPVVNESALFLPLAKGVTSLMRGREHLPESKRLNTALILLICGLIPLFHGPLFLTAGFSNLILVGNLAQAINVHISWVQWLVFNLPLWGLLPIAFFYVVWYFKIGNLDIPGADEELPKMKLELGRISWPEIWTAVCLLIGLLLWITQGSLHNIDPGMVAVIVATLVFLPFGKLKFGEVSRHIMWDIWVLLGGAISLSGALYKSGLATWLAGFVVAPLQGGNLNPLVVLLIIVFGFHIPRAGIVSAVAAGAVFIPLTIGVAQHLGLNVLPFSLIVTNAMSYAFFLPISITAFLIAWGASGASGASVIKFGVPLSIISNLYVVFVQSAWLALLGYPLK